MDFRQFHLQDGTSVIKGEGLIGPGDAARLRKVAPLADLDHRGNKMLLLNSQGGEVVDALDTADVIDEFHFETVVAPGDVCLSACASILFLAGDAHRVLGDGLLGFHSCMTNSPAAAEIAAAHCNRQIARFMEEQGYPADLMYTMLSGATLRTISVDGVHYSVAIPRPEIHCWGLQQFAWMEKFDEDVRPCIQLIMGHPVGSARDWDLPIAQREILSPQIPAGLYVGTWTPPGGWSYGTIYDGVSIGFRRWNKFPGGPEIEVFCALQARGSWLVLLRRMIDGARPADGLAFRTTRGVAFAVATARTTPSAGFIGAPFNFLMESFVFDSDLGDLLMGPDGPAEFVLLDGQARPLQRITVDIAGARKRLPNARRNCAGRFPGSE